MFYRLIQRKREEWLSADSCPVKSLLSYITRRDMMRDAQVDALKTYLFLKIACDNKPLWRLFSEGEFLTMDIDSMPLTVRTRDVLRTNRAAATLYEYACLADEHGQIMAPALKEAIEKNPDAIDYANVFHDIFYGVNYPDYIFSLPMGAGKTYLMAAFIYLDLYFSETEPDNPAFAHNFMVLAPSGLKSSILPSIRTIRDFDPTWILPEPTASRLKRQIIFEVLDEQKSAAKSNLVKNPNAQRISNHQPYDSLRGLVMVTNAEKVILNKMTKDSNPLLLSGAELKETNLYNELRSTVAKVPRLAIFIDEVHHASDGDIKLRQVVNKWAEGNSFNCVLGFSGTPYLSSADNVRVTPELSIQNRNLSNVVYYYPLIYGVGNFLKAPQIKVSTGGWQDIVSKGTEEFIEKYGETSYATGGGTLPAKLAIYCPRIEDLEENIYPLVSGIVSAHGMNPSEVILKYHRGNRSFPAPAGAETEFASLDTYLSKIRIILLVQIGKEGWDCRSLTGVILPQKGACPQNMVLQTSCRCLRQVVRHDRETALIWLNKDNGETLNKELLRQQHTSIEEINKGGARTGSMLKRYSRIDKLHLPPIDFFQMKISWPTDIEEEKLDIAANLSQKDIIAPADKSLVKNMDLSGKYTHAELISIANGDDSMPVTFSAWIHRICGESLGTLPLSEMKPYRDLLRGIFLKITVEKDGERWPSEEYNHAAIRANIRKAFSPRHKIVSKEEVIPQRASILTIDNLRDEVYTDRPEEFYPDQEKVSQIISGGRQLKDRLAKAVQALGAISGNEAAIKAITGNPENYEDMDSGVYNKTYHYLPYHFDSTLEKDYFSQSLLTIIRDRNLEVYYNGDDNLTDFKISCYRRQGKDGWKYLGKYVPDFLMLRRDEGNSIHQVLIIETKGEGFAAKFKERKEFLDSTFTEINNEEAGYEKFSFLYLEDSLKQEEREQRTIEAITNFFK